MNHEFRSVPRIICEAGALQELGYVFRSLGAQRVLLVCDPGIVSLGFAGRAQAVLEAAGCAVAVFDQVTPDPSSAVIEQAASQAKAFQADGVLGLGGGSSLDAAKLVALLINSEMLLLDEPTSGVSAEEKTALMDTVMRVVAQHQVTVLFVEHDMDVVRRYVSRILAFYSGEVLADGAPEAVLANPRVQEFVTGGPNAHKRAAQ